MSDGLDGDVKRLHPLSWVFYFANLTPHVVFPLFGFLVLGQSQKQWALWALVFIVPIYLWVGLRASLYRYCISADELVIRDGVIDRTLRHIPLARIQNVSQRRKFLHRMLGVTELRLESASGKKPEAIMAVLSIAAATELEAILRGHDTSLDLNASTGQASGRVLHKLAWSEILRLGLISNRGMVITVLLFGIAMRQDALRNIFSQRMSIFSNQVRHMIADQIALHHYFWLALLFISALLGMVILLRLLSILLAVLRYKGFTLELEGERLLARHGLGTQVRTSARLPRLQRWLLEESWLHRRFRRCRLAVTVVGSSQLDRRNKFGADGNFTELAPIATMEQAQALLRLCLPRLEWDQLQWQSLPAAARHRLLKQARWLLPATPGLFWLNHTLGWHLPWPILAVGLCLLTAALVGHALAWQRFAGYAESGDILVWRSGVFHKRWVIIAISRLQSVRLSSSALDRRLGIQTLQADTQGGSRRQRALHIPSLNQATALALRERIWQRMHTHARF
jgi:putative membrane protein